MRLGGFEWHEENGNWIRHVSYGRSIWVMVEKDKRYNFPAPYLAFRLVPMIAEHGLQSHINHQLSASIAFEVAGAIAELEDGVMLWQGELLGDCLKELPQETRNKGYRILSTSPRLIRHEDLCYGFRTALERGAAMLSEKGDGPADLTEPFKQSIIDTEEE